MLTHTLCQFGNILKVIWQRNTHVILSCILCISNIVTVSILALESIVFIGFQSVEVQVAQERVNP